MRAQAKPQEEARSARERLLMVQPAASAGSAAAAISVPMAMAAPPSVAPSSVLPEAAAAAAGENHNPGDDGPSSSPWYIYLLFEERDTEPQYHSVLNACDQAAENVQQQMDAICTENAVHGAMDTLAEVARELVVDDPRDSTLVGVRLPKVVFDWLCDFQKYPRIGKRQDEQHALGKNKYNCLSMCRPIQLWKTVIVRWVQLLLELYHQRIRPGRWKGIVLDPEEWQRLSTNGPETFPFGAACFSMLEDVEAMGADAVQTAHRLIEELGPCSVAGIFDFLYYPLIPFFTTLPFASQDEEVSNRSSAAAAVHAGPHEWLQRSVYLRMEISTPTGTFASHLQLHIGADSNAIAHTAAQLREQDVEVEDSWGTSETQRGNPLRGLSLQATVDGRLASFPVYITDASASLHGFVAHLKQDATYLLKARKFWKVRLIHITPEPILPSLYPHATIEETSLPASVPHWHTRRLLASFHTVMTGTWTVARTPLYRAIIHNYIKRVHGLLLVRWSTSPLHEWDIQNDRSMRSWTHNIKKIHKHLQRQLPQCANMSDGEWNRLALDYDKTESVATSYEAESDEEGAAEAFDNTAASGAAAAAGSAVAVAAAALPARHASFERRVANGASSSPSEEAAAVGLLDFRSSELAASGGSEPGTIHAETAVLVANSAATPPSVPAGLINPSATTSHVLSNMRAEVSTDVDLQRPRIEAARDREREQLPIRDEIDRAWADIVGQEELKEQLYDWAQKSLCDVQRLKLASQHRNLPQAQRILAAPKDLQHMLFLGPPGTGKTTLARLVGRLYRIIAGSNAPVDDAGVFEVNAQHLTGEYLGTTKKVVREIFENNKGRCIFIDEAYTISRRSPGSENLYGREAIDELMSNLDPPGGQGPTSLVILAGYEKDMMGFLQSNPGLSRRIPHTFTFKPYKPETLAKLFHRMLNRRGEKFIYSDPSSQQVSGNSPSHAAAAQPMQIGDHDDAALQARPTAASETASSDSGERWILSLLSEIVQRGTSMSPEDISSNFDLGGAPDKLTLTGAEIMALHASIEAENGGFIQNWIAQSSIRRDCRIGSSGHSQTFETLTQLNAGDVLDGLRKLARNAVRRPRQSTRLRTPASGGAQVMPLPVNPELEPHAGSQQREAGADPIVSGPAAASISCPRQVDQELEAPNKKQKRDHVR